MSNNGLIIFSLLVTCGVVLASNKDKKRDITLNEVLVLDGKNEFIKVGEIIADAKSNIYVSDDYSYSVKRFNSGGLFQDEFGKRGRNKGEFNSFPFRLIYQRDTIAIAELGSSRIQFFTAAWAFVGEVFVAGTVVDIAFAQWGGVYVSILPFSRKKEDVLLLYTKDGLLLSKILLNNLSGERGLDLVQLAVDQKDNLIVAYHFINTVSVYDAQHASVSEFKLPGVPERAATAKSQYDEIGTVPEDEIIKDVAIDPEGNIFLLLGDYTKNPSQDVVVMNKQGSMLTKFTLPLKTGFIYIDNAGYLYTREKQRTIVKKYRLVYHGF